MEYRRGSRIQKGGGGFVHSEGGGGFVQKFQERIRIVAGSWANQQAKKIADRRGEGGGGGSDHPPKNLYPRMGIECHGNYCARVGLMFVLL